MSRHSTFPHHHSSLSNTASSSTLGQNNPLQARIALKRAELANLQQLRDLSATLASQMSTLEQKLSTLRDGTEAVACVLANWENVLGVIGMVGASAARGLAGPVTVENDEEEDKDKEEKQSLPETLVRIPVGVKMGQAEEGDET